jgi:hypothetical protein
MSGRALLILALAALLAVWWLRQRARQPYTVTTPGAGVLVPNDPGEFALWEEHFRSLEMSHDDDNGDLL